MILPTILSLVLRFLFRRSSLPPSIGSLTIYTPTFLAAFFISSYLVKIGTPRRDPTTGTLISYGEDLNQPGVIEWCFDLLYITCMTFLYISFMSFDVLSGTCQVGSGAFGEWFWWLYMIVCLAPPLPSLPHADKLLDSGICCIETLDFGNIAHVLRSRPFGIFRKYSREGVNIKQAPGKASKATRKGRSSSTSAKRKEIMCLAVRGSFQYFSRNLYLLYNTDNYYIDARKCQWLQLPIFSMSFGFGS